MGFQPIVRYRVFLARELRAHIILYQKGMQLHHTKIWGTPLEELLVAARDVQVKTKLPNRVKISFALRECATLVESSSSTFKQVLEMVRFLPYNEDAPKEVLDMRPQLIFCDLEPTLRIKLFKEIFVRAYLGKRLKDDAATRTTVLVEEMGYVDTLVHRATEKPILDEMFNDTLADFVQAMNAPRFTLALAFCCFWYSIHNIHSIWLSGLEGQATLDS